MCGKLSFTVIPQCSSIFKSHWIVVVSVFLESAFASIKQNQADNSISLHIEESLKSEVGNRIDFANAILINEKYFKGENRVYYSLMKT